MSAGQGEDLGHGVYVSPSVREEVIVVSPRLALEWRVAEGQAPGSAVLWSDQSFEVIGREPAGAGDRWILRLWDQTKAMRTVHTLDRESVAWLAEGAALEKRERRTRAGTMLLLPLLGLAPAALQKRWAESWEFVPSRATTISALGEMILGGVFLLELVAMTVGGSVILPAWLQWLAYLGPILFVSGIARLILVFSDGEPVGSLLGMPLKFLIPRTVVAHEQHEPHTIEAPPSIVRTTLVTTGVSLGPRSDQERWAAHLGINAIWLTVMGAGAELVGGVTNLGDDLGSGGVFLVVLDFFLVGEGLLRLGSVVTGRPMGSVFGWMLRPLYRRYLPSATPDGSK